MYGKSLIVVAALAASLSIAGCDSGGEETAAVTPPAEEWNPEPVDATKIAGLYYINRVINSTPPQTYDYTYLYIDASGNLYPYNYMQDDVDSEGDCWRTPVAGDINHELIGMRLAYDAEANEFWIPSTMGAPGDRWQWNLDASGNLVTVSNADLTGSPYWTCATNDGDPVTCIAAQKPATSYATLLANLCP